MIRNNHFEGLCCAIRNAARLVTMTEQEDIGTTVSTNAVYAEKALRSPYISFSTISIPEVLDMPRKRTS